MIINIIHMDPQTKFEIKLHISLINYATRIIPVYPEKREVLNQYIAEQSLKLKTLLNISTKKFKIFEKDELLYESR